MNSINCINVVSRVDKNTKCHVCAMLPPFSAVGEGESWPRGSKEVPGRHWGVCPNQGGQPFSPSCGSSTSQVKTPTVTKISDCNERSYVCMTSAYTSCKCFLPFLHCLLDWNRASPRCSRNTDELWKGYIQRAYQISATVYNWCETMFTFVRASDSLKICDLVSHAYTIQ